MPMKLRTRPVKLTVRRQEPDKPIIVEMRFPAKLQHISRIPSGLEYETFKLLVQSTFITLSGSPSDLWRLEKLFGTTYFEAFLAITETYCQLELPVSSERDACSPQLTLETSIEGDIALTVREMLREHISAITGVDH